MQKKKVKLSKSAKGALLYMLVVLSIFAVLETVVCRLPSHFDESNTEAYTGTLSHVEKYTTWHIGYRAMHSKQHIRLHFTDGNVYAAEYSCGRKAIFALILGPQAWNVCM